MSRPLYVRDGHCHGESASRTFRPGQAVRWNPPPGAFSPRSKQARLAGQTGCVLPHDPGGYVPVRFDQFSLLLNADYLEAA